MATTVTVVTRARHGGHDGDHDHSAQPSTDKAWRARTWRALRVAGLLSPLFVAASLAAGGLFSPAFGGTVRVVPGDTLWAIAARLHTTVAQLASANGITNPNRLMVGMVLQIPGGPSPSPPPAPSPAAGYTGAVAVSDTVVVVRPGDTLTAIAARYHTTLAALVRANNISNPNFVLIGTQLHIPGTLAPLPGGSAPADALTAKLLAHPDRLALRPAFVSAAAASGLPANLLEALCWWESGWQSTATSSTGAIGVCQLEPSTVGYARTTLLHNAALDPRSGPDNIAMAAAYLRDLIGRAGGNSTVAIAGYYQGLPSVQQHGMIPSAQTYVRGVAGYAAIFPPGG
jgi:LysM repeat protein